MVPITRDNNLCKFRSGSHCANDLIANKPIVNDSLQSRWYCSNCKYYAER